MNLERNISSKKNSFGQEILNAFKNQKPLRNNGNNNLKDIQKKSRGISSPEMDNVVKAGNPRSKEWKVSVDMIKNSNGKRVHILVNSRTDAEKLLMEARPDLKCKPQYTTEPYTNGYEFHPIDNKYGAPHIKWKDWRNGKRAGGEGHIFFWG